MKIGHHFCVTEPTGISSYHMNGRWRRRRKRNTRRPEDVYPELKLENMLRKEVTRLEEFSSLYFRCALICIRCMRLSLPAGIHGAGICSCDTCTVPMVALHRTWLFACSSGVRYRSDILVLLPTNSRGISLVLQMLTRLLIIRMFESCCFLSFDRTESLREAAAVKNA